MYPVRLRRSIDSDSLPHGSYQSFDRVRYSHEIPEGKICRALICS